MRHAILVVAAMAFPAVSSAQDTFIKGLTPAGMPSVFVTDDRGVETPGRLVRLDPDAVVVLVGDEQRRFETARVVRIEKRGDSLRNGALIGAAAGLLNGVVVMGLAECPSWRRSCAGIRVAGVMYAAAAYAAVGTAIDALVQGRTAIYARPAVRLTAVPKGAAVSLSVTW